jgi:hypothetical protein
VLNLHWGLSYAVLEKVDNGQGKRLRWTRSLKEEGSEMVDE